VADDGTESIVFDVLGDSGAPSAKQLNEYETKVTDLLTRDAAASQPAFLFHVGDVVYFYGEKEYYYSQFYDPFRAYPAPIFAIPGNHDGCIYDSSQVSLADFQSAFCATKPGRWVGSGGILRSAMTQPGVYFTLDAPLVSIVGLYSNCGESLGWLDEQQLTFLYTELVRLKKLKQTELRAVILAIHHIPRWFPQQNPKDPNNTAIDAACEKARFWPDAVICGHAHLYQRVVRVNVGPNKHDVPYP
jgi:predicted phosphodiesterase